MHPTSALLFGLALHAAAVAALSGSIMQHNAQMASLNLLPNGKPMKPANDNSEIIHFPRTRQFVKQPPPPPPPPSANQTGPFMEKIVAEYVQLPIDHFGDIEDTFRNRFWVAEADYRPGGPVFVYDVGEANASSTAVLRLRNETSFFKQIVREFGGIGVVWEHRQVNPTISS
jgi:Serine carboxypeptidase S28